MSEGTAVKRRRPRSEGVGSTDPYVSITVSRASSGYAGVTDEAPGGDDGWLLSLIRRVEAMRELRDGWDTYGAEAPNAVAVANAASMLRALADMGLRPDRVAPSAEGGVAIALLRDSRYVNLECYNTGEVLAGLTNGEGIPVVWEIAEDDLTRTLERVRDYIEGRSPSRDVPQRASS